MTSDRLRIDTPTNTGGGAYATKINQALRDIDDSSVFSVKARNNAVGDGVEPASEAILETIADADAAGGGVVLLPLGTCIIDSKLEYEANNVQLVGFGPSSVLKADAGLNDHVIEAQGGFLGFSEFTIDGNRLNQVPSGSINHGDPVGGDYSGLRLRNSSGTTIRRVFSHSCVTAGIDVQGAGSSPYLGPVSQLTIEDCHTYDQYGRGESAHGIVLIGIDGLILRGNHSYDNDADGIYFQSNPYAVVANNHCFRNGAFGIELQSHIVGSTFSGNVAKGNGTRSILGGFGAGIGGAGFGTFNGNTFSGNSCIENGGAGMYLGSGSANPSNSTLTANICKNNGQGGGEEAGIELSGCNQILIVGNSCYDDQVSKTQGWAIRSGGGTENHVVVANYAPTNKNGAISLPGSGSVVVANMPDKAMRTRIVATGSLPAVSGTLDGELLVEDQGGGVYKMVWYSGGQRFRVTGTSF